MNKTVQRLLLFFIGVPFLLLIVYIPYKSHLLLHITLLIISLLAFLELYTIFSKKISLQARPFLFILTAFFPILSYVSLLFFENLNIHILLIIEITILIIFEVLFTNKKDDSIFELSMERVAASFFIIFYCGYLFSHVSNIASLPQSEIYLIVFLTFVFGCDSFAWLFGILLGNGNRGFFTVSKKKSLAGFIGGILGTLLLGYIVKLLFPQAFFGPYYKVFVLAGSTSILAIVGDLFESVLKRSADIKDSGVLIPGRGGILDSIDSMIFTAPLYYYLILLFYGV